MPASALQVGRDLGELVEGGLQVFGNLGGYDIGVGKTGRVFQTIVLEPEDVQAELVALEELVIVEGPEAVGGPALVAVVRVIAGDKIVQIRTFQGVGLQGEDVAVVPEPRDYGLGFA